MPLLAEVFEDAGALEKLEAFTSENGAKFYGVPLNERTLTLTQEEWRPCGPDFSANMRVFGIERMFRWKVVDQRPKGPSCKYCGEPSEAENPPSPDHIFHASNACGCKGKWIPMSALSELD